MIEISGIGEEEFELNCQFGHKSTSSLLELRIDSKAPKLPKWVHSYINKNNQRGELKASWILNKTIEVHSWSVGWVWLGWNWIKELFNSITHYSQFI